MLGGPSLSTDVFVSGALAGVVSRTVVAPLDRVKTLLQVGRPRMLAAEGTLATMRLLYREGGMLSLFMGNTANTVKGATRGDIEPSLVHPPIFLVPHATPVSAFECSAMPEVGVKFLTYEHISAWQKRHRQAEPTVAERLLPGAVAGISSCVCIYPLEIAKTRMTIASPGQYDGVVHCLATLVRNEGAAALTQGLGASLLGIVPFCGEHDKMSTEAGSLAMSPALRLQLPQPCPG